MMKGARELARQLADATREAGREYGDSPAQALAYLLLARRWGELIDPAQAFPNPDAARQIEEALDSTDIAAVADDYSAAGRDPVVYFHEEFIRACSPRLASARGVHYTPPEVVSYIVRAAASALESNFDCDLNESVVVDPCCGVGTFLRHIARNTAWRPRMIGLELIESTAAIALQLVPQAEIACADFLDHPPSPQPSPAQRGEGVLVILGNPPYSGHSANSGKIAELMADYKTGLREKNPKWLQDDYVKFIRQAQHWIDRAGRGIVAFITNHSFTFNPTFRAMRESLMNSFDEICMLDLGGNAKLARSGDENVFPIQMGVAITLLIKQGKRRLGSAASFVGCGHGQTQRPELRRRARVAFIASFDGAQDAKLCEQSMFLQLKYAALRGTKESKLAALAKLGYADTPWEDIRPISPFRLFTPTNGMASSRYARFVSLSGIFEQSCVGFVTSRDAFAVDFDRNALLQRIADLRDPGISPASIRERYPVGDLDIESARRELLNDLWWQERAVEVLYRPFDRRWAYLSQAVMERPRLSFMENMLRENIALAVGRAGHATGSSQWDVVFITDRPTDLNLFRRGGAMLFPRYLYDKGKRRSNIKIDSHDPDLVIPYIYAVLHSGAYRERFADFLAIDFPRIPFTDNCSLFSEIAAIGERLMSAHLIRHDYSPGAVAAASNARPNIVIGGYKLPRKYVDNRRGRVLMPHEEYHVAQIEAAIVETERIRRSLDALIAGVIG